MYTHAALDRMVETQQWLCPIRADKRENGAYYSPSKDIVVLPMKAQFNIGDSPEETYRGGMEYYSTMLHEMTHSTMTPERLNREMGGRFGDPKYAKEELVAELTAAMISHSMGFDSRITDNSAAYLDSWIGVLKQEPKFIVSVMADVNKASDLILDHVDKQRLALGEQPYLAKNDPLTPVSADEEMPFRNAAIVKTRSGDYAIRASYDGVELGLKKVSRETARTFFQLTDWKDKEAFLNDELASIKTQSEVFDWAENYFDLEPATEYVFYCVGQDRSGRDTQLFEIPFTTYAEGSDEIPNFVYTEGAKDFYMQNYTVTPNALCKQLVLYQQTEGAADGTIFGVNNWKGLTLEMFDSWKDINIGAVMSGTYITSNEELKAEATTTDLELENPLDVYVIAYDEMYKPFLVKKYANSTPAFNANAALPDASDFTITVTDVTMEGFNIAINYTSDNTRAYFYDIISGDYWDNQIEHDMAALKNEMITTYLNLGWCYNRKSIENNYVIDPSIPDFVAGAKFYIGVLAMNENGPIEGGWAEEVALSEPFYLPE